MNFKEYVKAVAGGAALNLEQTEELFNSIMAGEVSEAEIAAVLIGMKLRGETPEEVAGAVSAMNKNKNKFDANGLKAIDTCGTGGDGKSTVNVSTAVSIVTAALGIPVVKHGNVAMSGKVGSADILKLKNIPIEFENGGAENYFEKNGFVFLFAQKYHPAMRFAGPVRRAVGVPTIFNILGPLANPADVYAQAIGMGSLERVELVSKAVALLGRDNMVLYTSRDGYDEVSSKAVTDCRLIKGGEIKSFEIDPADFFVPFDMPVISDNDDAVEKFDAAISGDDENLANLIALNTALALYVYGDTASVKEGFEKAKKCIMSGQALEKLKSLHA